MNPKDALNPRDRYVLKEDLGMLAEHWDRIAHGQASYAAEFRDKYPTEQAASLAWFEQSSMPPMLYLDLLRLHRGEITARVVVNRWIEEGLFDWDGTPLGPEPEAGSYKEE